MDVVDNLRASGTQVLARTLVRDMLAQGYGRRQVVALASALLDELTRRMISERRRREP